MCAEHPGKGGSVSSGDSDDEADPSGRTEEHVMEAGSQAAPSSSGRVAMQNLGEADLDLLESMGVSGEQASCTLCSPRLPC